MAIRGTCADGYEPVRDAFAANFASAGEVGAAVAAVVDGRTVVDLWGGMADPLTGRPWDEHTPVLVFSTTKGLTSVCTLLLWERGQLDLDAPVAEVWPEFAAAGKTGVTTRHILCHQAGLPALDLPISVQRCHDLDVVAARLAEQEPRWEPGAAHGYHALTFGWLLGEVVRRVTGRSVGRMLADEVAGPLGLQTYIGLPPDLEPAVARLQAPRLNLGRAGVRTAGGDDRGTAFLTAILDVSSLTFQVFSNPPAQFDIESFNAHDLHQAEWPSANGITTARSLARLYGELACDRVLSSAVLDEAQRPHATGPDRVLAVRTSFGLGFSMGSEMLASAPAAFGHEGAGGSVGFADRTAGVGFGYVMNQVAASLGADPRARRLVDALYGCL